MKLYFVTIFITVCLFLAGCVSTHPLGTAMARATDANARANTVAAASVDAQIEAAKLTADADALEAAAKQVPTEQRIAAAVDARVKARSAVAVAQALISISKQAATDAKSANEDAEKEKIVQQKAADDRAWLKLCRWIGLGGIGIGVLLGAIIFYFTKSITAAGSVSGSIGLTGMLVVGYGATVTWLPAVLLCSIVAGMIVWAIIHRSDNKVTNALSESVDALRGKAQLDPARALEQLQNVVDTSWNKAKLEAKRLTWKL